MVRWDEVSQMDCQHQPSLQCSQPSLRMVAWRSKLRMLSESDTQLLPNQGWFWCAAL